MVRRPGHLQGLEPHPGSTKGFATFYALLYDEHKNGTDSMLYGLYTTARGIFARTNDVKPIVSRKFDIPDDNFSYLAYQKGSFVLRMLRSQLGQDLYRRCIATYLERHKYGNVVTEDLCAGGRGTLRPFLRPVFRSMGLSRPLSGD